MVARALVIVWRPGSGICKALGNWTHSHAALTLSVSTFGHNLKNAAPILHVGLVLERDPSDVFSTKVAQTLLPADNLMTDQNLVRQLGFDFRPFLHDA